jgi:hypothetical protein
MYFRPILWNHRTFPIEKFFLRHFFGLDSMLLLAFVSFRILYAVAFPVPVASDVISGFSWHKVLNTFSTHLFFTASNRFTSFMFDNRISSHHASARTKFTFIQIYTVPYLYITHTPQPPVLNKIIYRPYTYATHNSQLMKEYFPHG